MSIPPRGSRSFSARLEARSDLGAVEHAPLAERQFAQSHRPDRHPLQAQHTEAERFKHPAHLAVFALGQHELRLAAGVVGGDQAGAFCIPKMAPVEAISAQNCAKNGLPRSDQKK